MSSLAEQTYSTQVLLWVSILEGQLYVKVESRLKNNQKRLTSSGNSSGLLVSLKGILDAFLLNAFT